MKRLLLPVLLSLSLALVACGGAPDKSRSSKSARAKDGPSTPITVVPPQEEDGEVDGKGKKWGGWRWKGQRDDCYFVHKNRCFAKKKQACKAAGCAKSCRTDGAAPAKVSCPKKK